MIEDLNIADNKIEPLDISSEDELPISQQQYEYNLQEIAGLEPSADFIGTRVQLAQKQKQENEQAIVDTLSTLAQSGEDIEKITQAASILQNDFTGDNVNSSLEEEAARASIEKSFEDNQVTRDNALEDKEDYDDDAWTAKDFHEKRLKEAMRNYQEGDSPWMTTIGIPLAQQFIPFIRFTPQRFRNQISDSLFNIMPFTSIIDTATIGDYKGEISAASIAERQREDYTNHYMHDTPEEFAKYVDNIITDLGRSSPSSVGTTYDNIFGVPDKTNDVFSLFDLLDVGGMIKAAGKASKVGYKSAAVMDKSVGNMKAANAKVMKAIEEGTDTVTVLEDGATVSAMQPFQSQGMVSQTIRVEDEMKELLADKEWMNRVNNTISLSGLNDNELAVLKDNAMEEIRQSFGKNNGIIDIQAMSVEPDINNLYRFRISIGGGLDGKLGMTKKAAQNLANKLKLTPDEYSIVKKDGQGYYIDIDRAVRDNEYIIAGADKELEHMMNPDISSSIFSKTFKKLAHAAERAFAGRVQITEKMHQKDIVAERLRLGLEDFFRRESKQVLKGLNKHDYKVWKDLNKKQHEGRGTWFTDEQIKETYDASDDVLAANRLHRKIDLTNFYIFNRRQKKKMDSSGYKMLDNGTFVKPVEVREDNFGDMIIKSSSIDADGKTVLKDITSFQDLSKELERGKKVVEIFQGDAIARNVNYSHMLIDPTSTTLHSLPDYVLPYTAGGRRAYTWGTAYVKVGTKMAAAGRVVNGYSKTIVASTDIKGLKEYAAEINKLRDIYKADKKIQQHLIDEADFKRINITNVENMNKMFRTEENPKGLLDVDYEAQVLEDGEPYRYNNNLQSLPGDSDDIENALNDLIRVREAMYDGRGNLLDGLNGESAKIVNPVNMLEDCIRKTAHTATLGELRQWYLGEYRRNFEHLHEGGKTLSDFELINAPYVKSYNANEMHAAKSFRQHFERIMNIKTGVDKAIERGMQGLARDLGDSKMAELLGKSREDFEIVAKTDPLAAARTLEFMRVMFLNPAQFMKQSIDLASTALSHPLATTTAMFAQIPAVIGLIAKSRKMTGLESVINKIPGMKGLVEHLDTFGALKTVGEMDPILYKNVSSARRLTTNKIIKGIKTIGLSPYTVTQGEVNLVTDIASYLIHGGEDARKIIGHWDDLTRNMTTMSQTSFQYGQKLGFTKNAAEWAGYKIHTLESIVFGRGLTKRERMAIAAVSLVAEGGLSNISKEYAANKYREIAAGNSELANWLSEKTGADLDTIARGYCYGILNAALAPYGINFDETMGYDDTVDTLVDAFNMESDERPGQRFIDLFPASRSILMLAKTPETIRDILAPKTTGFDLYMFAEKIAKDPVAASGAKSLAKTLVLMRAGEYINSRGESIKHVGLEDRGTAAALVMLGLKPIETQELDIEHYVGVKMEKVFRDAKKDMKELVDTIKAYDVLNIDDPAKRQLERDHLFYEYEVARKGYSKMLEDTYSPQLANRFNQELEELWQTRKAGEKTTEKLRKFDNMFYEYTQWKENQ